MPQAGGDGEAEPLECLRAGAAVDGQRVHGHHRQLGVGDDMGDDTQGWWRWRGGSGARCRFALAGRDGQLHSPLGVSEDAGTDGLRIGGASARHVG